MPSVQGGANAQLSHRDIRQWDRLPSPRCKPSTSDEPTHGCSYHSAPKCGSNGIQRPPLPIGLAAAPVRDHSKEKQERSGNRSNARERP